MSPMRRASSALTTRLRIRLEWGLGRAERDWALDRAGGGLVPGLHVSHEARVLGAHQAADQVGVGTGESREGLRTRMGRRGAGARLTCLP